MEFSLYERRTDEHTQHSVALAKITPAHAPKKYLINKKHLKNVGPIHYCEPPHAHSPGVASGTVARRLRIDVHDANDNDNA